MKGCVKVYEVTTQGSQLAYQLSSHEWKGMWTKGVAVSASLPDSMLVICQWKPYVYQFPCHQATQWVKKHKMDRAFPYRVVTFPYYIVANANTAAIAFIIDSSIAICSLPDFTHQYHVRTRFSSWDLSISTDKLLVMGTHNMVVKPLGDMNQDLCKMKSSDTRWEFASVCFRSDATEIYAACGEGCVHRYKWNADKSQYVNIGCVIDDIGKGRGVCLSVTSDGLLAFSRKWPSSVQVYRLE